ncbi:MAG TPA: carboxypeptidase regulatory-like domain-containing protein [Xanthobacteraceae bacterium]|jgi:streptogramin lyase|nr:carboxypeptidase regulatory-like domain-containing protein [Xanthobacteraceae bacterium]
MTLKTFSRYLAAGVAFGAMAAAAHAADNRGVVEGVVNNAAGQPVAGAMVKLINADRRLTFMVVSQDQGRFAANDLPPGQYVVQGIGGGFESNKSAPVNVEGGKNAKIDLTLANKQGPMLPPAWPQRIPEEQIKSVSLDLPPGDGQSLVEARCTTCHNLQRIVVKRTTLPEWEHIIERMRGQMAIQNVPDLSNQEAATIANYLTANFKPEQPYDGNSRLPRELLTGKATKYRAVTYDLVNHYAEPHDVAADPQGNGWVAERAGKLGRFDPRTYEFVEVAPPPGPAAPNRQRLGNPQIDKNGILWVADGPNGRWLSYDTKYNKFASFQWPKGHGNAGGNSMAVHPDGTIYATGLGREVRALNPEKVEFKFYESPSAHGKQEPGAYGLAVAGDGSVWWAEDNIDKMARIDPATGKVEEYAIPYSEGHAFPRRMNSDAHGDLWVALWQAGKLMKIDYKTREMKIFSPPTANAGAYSVVVDKQNDLVWVSEHKVDKIARFNPKTEEWVEFPLPEAQSDPRRIDIDPTNPNRIYFSGNTAGRVGFVEVLP